MVWEAFPCFTSRFARCEEQGMLLKPKLNHASQTNVSSVLGHRWKVTTGNSVHWSKSPRAFCVMWLDHVWHWRGVCGRGPGSGCGCWGWGSSTMTTTTQSSLAGNDDTRRTQQSRSSVQCPKKLAEIEGQPQRAILSCSEMVLFELPFVKQQE